MSYPEGYIWGFPGVYSLTANYGSSNSFYFSTYVAVTIINFLEFWDHRHSKLAVISLVLSVLVSIMLLCTRAHFSIDIFGGLIFGHYFWMFAEWLSYLIDFKLFKIPFHKRFPDFIKSCANCDLPINEWVNIKFCSSPRAKDELIGAGNEEKDDGCNNYQEEREFAYSSIRAHYSKNSQ